MSERPAASERSQAWFVQAAGKVWGPYSPARVEAFVAEGRVAAETLTGASERGPFMAAGLQPGLRALFEADEPVTETEVEAEPAPRPPASEPPAPAAGPVQVLLVWAWLKSQRPERFEQAVAIHGPFVRIGADLWVVRARMGPAALRNALTRRLDPADALMVVEAGLEQAAWFNLRGEADRSLRDLWTAHER